MAPAFYLDDVTLRDYAERWGIDTSVLRQALDAASAALEPTWISQQQQPAENKAEMVN